jgi:hypothetical protein
VITGKVQHVRVFSTLEEIAEGRRQTIEALCDILHARTDTTIEAVGRWERNSWSDKFCNRASGSRA